jgi:hypothetical protein
LREGFNGIAYSKLFVTEEGAFEKAKKIRDEKKKKREKSQ